MAVQIALFRGINVGKAKRIAMADLKAVFEGLGFTRVRTLLNSGNVVFEAGRSAAGANARRITEAVHARTSVEAKVLVIATSALDHAIAHNPFAKQADDPSRLLLGFYLGPDAQATLESLRTAHPDASFAVLEQACYLWCPEGILDNKVAERLLNAKYRDLLTTRNWNTALKLQAMAHTAAA